MIARFLWGYLCIAGFSSLLVYCACMAAARADRIREGCRLETLAYKAVSKQHLHERRYPYTSSLGGIAGKPTPPLGDTRSIIG